MTAAATAARIIAAASAIAKTPDISPHQVLVTLNWPGGETAASPRSGGRRAAGVQPLCAAGRHAARRAQWATIATMTEPQLRALVGARVSVVQGPQKVSHIAQQETGAKWVAEHGHTVVGTIHDLGVSASVYSVRPTRPRAVARTERRPNFGRSWYSSKLDRLFQVHPRLCAVRGVGRGAPQGARLRRRRLDTELPGP